MSTQAPGSTYDFETDPQWVDRLTSARVALAAVVPEVLGMLRSVKRPDAIAVGDWTTGEVAAHLSHAAAGEVFLANAIGNPATDALASLGDDIVTAATQFNAKSLGGDAERDPSRLADRIEQSVAEFTDIMNGFRGSEPVGWLGGVVLPSSALACHLLEEFVVHGYDIARAEGKRWSTTPEYAALSFGFLLDLIRFCNPDLRRTFVHQGPAAGVRACYDFRIRGARRDFMVFEDGLLTIEDPSNRTVDCHISAEPDVALLLGMGRIGRVKPVLTGRMSVWGRKPWLALKLSSLLRNP